MSEHITVENALRQNLIKKQTFINSNFIICIYLKNLGKIYFT